LDESLKSSTAPVLTVVEAWNVKPTRLLLRSFNVPPATTTLEVGSELVNAP